MRHALILVAAAAAAFLLASPCLRAQDLAERGRYLTAVADCEACHTDPAHPEQKFAGGRILQTPFGELATPNITPDRDTGIGNWSDAQLDAAVRHGVRADGKRLYPAMPYVYYTRMSADDVRAIGAYLQTLTSVHNAVNVNRLPFPFSIRAIMWIWDALFFSPGDFKPDPSQSTQWNRGAFLVQGPGHCAACHTPKNFLGADKHGMAFSGYATQGWFSPDLTENAAQGIADWSAEDIARYLKSGHNRYAAASGPMAEEVSYSSSQMTDTDLRAIAQYLKTLPGQATQEQPLPQSDPNMVAGAAIYQDLCTACHAADGHGVPELIPDIARSGSVASRKPTTVLRVVLQGAPTVATSEAPTAPAMPEFGRRLNDIQVAAVTTYVRNSWGHHASPVTTSEVREARADLQHTGSSASP